MGQKNKDPYVGRKILVSLLDGPKRAVYLGLKVNRSTGMANQSLGRYLKKGLVVREGEEWHLTKKGITQAAKWDYDLKLRNDHPSQVPVTTPAAKPDNVVFMRSLDGEEDWSKKGSVHDLPKKAYDPTAEAWDAYEAERQHHIDFLEEIVRLLISKNQ